MPPLRGPGTPPRAPTPRPAAGPLPPLPTRRTGPQPVVEAPPIAELDDGWGDLDALTVDENG
ncbi:MAG: hypothetical protein R3B09_31730 [Nannocystaceae bacterium]